VGGGPETEAALGGLLYRLNNIRVRVSQNGRSPRAYVVDVFIAIDIGKRGSVGLCDERWITSDGSERPNRAVDSRWHKADGAFKQMGRADKHNDAKTILGPYKKSRVVANHRALTTVTLAKLVAVAGCSIEKCSSHELER
jgi:hypothetical protein